MNRQISEKIKKLRTEKGLTQSEMADKLSITRSAYQKMETGESYSWARYLEELMAIFETTPKDFFSDIGKRVIQQNNYEGGIGYITEYLYQENKEMYEKLIKSYEKIIQSKEEQIELLKEMK
ncbi:MAG: helix-turn-helix domain-containing protein [Tannerella sp.]|jgi:transcriptional regulator with XRE-family HTH domain|nr:helix-turn-helix domain-containing protein [Tannerella sp.]